MAARMPDTVGYLWEQYQDHVRRGRYWYDSECQPDSGAFIAVKGRRLLNLSSYSYLGLGRHPKVIAACQKALLDYGAGTDGVRLLAGTLPVHKALESNLADFLGVSDAALFSSGYLASIAATSALIERSTLVLCDALAHASLIDGCLLTRARLARFEHNDINDLRALLGAAQGRQAVVVVDAVYSMDGDVVDLPAVCECAGQSNALTIVDEAHSIGVLGPTGRGISEHWGIPHDAVLVGSLSKAIPGGGGFIAGTREMITYIRHRSRPYVFSASLAPGNAAGASAALDVLREDREPLSKLRENIATFHAALAENGLSVRNHGTPIVSLVAGDAEKTNEIVARCQENGLFVLPILPPAVPEGTARLRLTVTSLHSKQDLEAAAEVLREAWRATMGAPSTTP